MNPSRELRLNAAIQRMIDEVEARFGVDALWLFGSQATGAERHDSDIDLAALFHRPAEPEELLDLRMSLSAELGLEVDLVDLENASPILAMQVLRNGRLLVDSDPKRRVAFVAGAPGRYEDLKIVRREAERALIERIRGGRP